MTHHTNSVPLSPHATPAHILVKPAGPDCNLRCGYCFYLEKHSLFDQQKACRMPDIVLENYTRSYIASQPTREVEFAWQGGEPTILGVDFFKRAVELQRKYGGDRVISNSLQTNGTLLNDEWCAFLAKEKFLIGLSIDGPEHIHNRYRVNANGRGSFKDVMRGLACLKKHGVEFNSLTCVTKESANDGKVIYNFLRDNGFRFMQFIPIVERMPDKAAEALKLQLATPPDKSNQTESPAVMPFTVEPLAYGQFMCDIFDEWIKRDVGNYFVNHFDVALAAWTGMNPPLCVYSKTCGSALAVEHDGNVYACDHFVYPQYLRGSVMNDDLGRIISSMRQRAFGMQKALQLTDTCKKCRHLKACNGGCLKHRFAKSPTGQDGHNYLCAGYLKFFDHIAPYMDKMADLLNQKRAPAEIMKDLPIG